MKRLKFAFIGMAMLAIAYSTRARELSPYEGVVGGNTAGKILKTCNGEGADSDECPRGL